MRAASGSSASTVAAESSCRLSQFGPFFSHCAATSRSRSVPSAASTASSVVGADLGARQRRRRERRAGAVEPDPDQADAALLDDLARPRFGRPPRSRHAWQLPSVGWPANGSSPPGVKMRTR